MGFDAVTKLVASFVESLEAEKGYSKNTCRAYQTDLNEFLKFTAAEGVDSNSEEQQTSSVALSDLDVLTIRKYLY